MRLICFKNSTNERRKEKKSNKNFSLFSKKKTHSLFNFIIQQSKIDENSERRRRLSNDSTFSSLEIDRFFFERHFRRSSKTSSKIECRFRIERRLRSDASLKRRSKRRDFFLVKIEKFVERIEQIK